MNVNRLYSDQLFTWSDNNARYLIVRIAQTACKAAQANARFGHLIAWFTHRALQTLRQTWLQMCRRSGTWSQVLLVGELPRLPAPNGLRAAGRSARCRRAPGKLPSCPRYHRRDLRDQPRTFTPSRGVLRTPGEPASSAAHQRHRFATGRRTHCQHARGLAYRRVRVGAERGDRR